MCSYVVCGPSSSARFLAAVVIAAVLLLSTPIAALHCQSDSGEDVDWWVAYKFPNTRHYGYADTNLEYLDESSSEMSDGYASCLNYTLSPIYGNDYYSVVMYNDEPASLDDEDALFVTSLWKSIADDYYDDDCAITPTDRNYPNPENPLEFGHAKGVVVVDDDGNGYWLVHSVPKYPLPLNETDYFSYMASEQVDYAQNFLCVSFSGWSTFNSIGSQLKYYYPDTYYTYFTDTGYGNLTTLREATVDFEHVEEKATSTIPLKSRSCNGTYWVQNVVNMTVGSWSWHYIDDHAKWAISSADNTSVYCGAGINRMESQGERGGGALCFESEDLNTSLYEAVTKAEWCDCCADDDEY